MRPTGTAKDANDEYIFVLTIAVSGCLDTAPHPGGIPPASIDLSRIDLNRAEVAVPMRRNHGTPRLGRDQRRYSSGIGQEMEKPMIDSSAD